MSALLVLIAGCGKYPDLSPAAYELTKTLDNVCALKNEGQLASLEGMIDEASTEGQLSASDEKSLRKILGLAQKGNWDEASRQVRRLRLDQNQPAPRGEPVPRKHRH